MGVTFKGKWSEFQLMVDPRRMEQSINRARRLTLNRAGTLVKRRIKEEIKSKSSIPNVAATVLMKGSDTPWVQTKALYKMVTVKKINKYSRFIGWLFSDQHYSGLSAGKLAAIIHNGIAIRVSPKMRVYWNTKLVEENPGLKALSPNKTFINIKGRPIMDNVMSDQEMVVKIFDILVQQFKKAYYNR